MAHDGRRPSMRSRSTFVALCLLFVCSGACGLTYQVLWLRLLSLVFGVTVHAASTVLAAFMAGLALGSLLAERLARRGHPLRVFAALEAGIAVAALATPALLGAAASLYRPLSTIAGDSLWILTAGRFVASFAVLLVPTVLMGATLPVLSRADLVRASGARLGTLYAVNTTGALAGALATGYVLIGGIGIQRTFLLAAALNVAVAAIAWWLCVPRPAAGCGGVWHRADDSGHRHRASCHLGALRDGRFRRRGPRPRDRLVPHPGAVPARHLLRVHDDAGHGARRHRPGQRAGVAGPDPGRQLEPDPGRHHGRDGHRRPGFAGAARCDLCRRVAHFRTGPGVGRGDFPPRRPHGLRIPDSPGVVDAPADGRAGRGAGGRHPVCGQRHRRHRRRRARRVRAAAVAWQPPGAHRLRRPVPRCERRDAGHAPPARGRGGPGRRLRRQCRRRARSLRGSAGPPARPRRAHLLERGGRADLGQHPHPRLPRLADVPGRPAPGLRRAGDGADAPPDRPLADGAASESPARAGRRSGRRRHAGRREPARRRRARRRALGHRPQGR